MAVRVCMGSYLQGRREVLLSPTKQAENSDIDPKGFPLVGESGVRKDIQWKSLFAMWPRRPVTIERFRHGSIFTPRAIATRRGPTVVACMAQAHWAIRRGGRRRHCRAG